MTTTFSCPDAPRVFLEASAEDLARGISPDYQSLLPEVNYLTKPLQILFKRMGLELNPNEGSWSLADLPAIRERLESLVQAKPGLQAHQLPRGVLPKTYVDQVTRETAYQAMQLLELVKAAQVHGYPVVWQ